MTAEQAVGTMKAAFDGGAVFWNGGEFYGTPEHNSMHLLARYFTEYPAHAEKVVLSIKGGLRPNMSADGTPEGVRRSVENVLRTLNGKKSLDIFECARVDPNTPIETTIGALAKLVEEKKLKAISLSEVKAETIRRAHKVHPISAVEVEFSLWATDILTNGVAAVCAELRIPIVAYSPLGRGFLTGEIKSPDDIPDGDFRKTLPRFQPENFGKNIEMVERLREIAEKKGCSPAQLALAWVKQQSEQRGMPAIIPIPGATTEKRVRENLQEIRLGELELKDIDQILKSAEIIGDRYGGHAALQMNG